MPPDPWGVYAFVPLWLRDHRLRGAFNRRGALAATTSQDWVRGRRPRAARGNLPSSEEILKGGRDATVASLAASVEGAAVHGIGPAACHDG